MFDKETPFTLSSRAVSMRAVRTFRWTKAQRALISPACIVPKDTSTGGTHMFDHLASTFLRPLAPRALPRFNATMGALTPARLSPPDRSPRFMYTTFRPFRLQPPNAPPPPLSHATPQRDGSPASTGPGFATRLQARRIRPAESSSSSYGLVVHLQLLPTPPRGDAVTFGYRPESAYLKRTFTALTMYTSGRTDARDARSSATRIA